MRTGVEGGESEGHTELGHAGCWRLDFCLNTRSTNTLATVAGVYPESEWWEGNG